jgi:ribosomal protein L7/L12
MKLSINLGVPTEALLKHPTVCFRLSRAMTRVSDALVFGEFYLKQTKGPVIAPRDLEHMSASIFSSSKSAEGLALLVDDPDLRKAISAYSVNAQRLNTAIRSNLPSIKTLKAKAKGQKVKAEPITASFLSIRTAALRSKLSEIEKKVEDLCTVRSKVEMITRHRTKTGAGLKEAKDAIEQLKDYGPLPEASTTNVSAPATTSVGRVRMSGSGVTPKKRPMYPRYFVASMGRSRR